MDLLILCITILLLHDFPSMALINPGSHRHPGPTIVFHTLLWAQPNLTTLFSGVAPGTHLVITSTS